MRVVLVSWNKAFPVLFYHNEEVPHMQLFPFVTVSQSDSRFSNETEPLRHFLSTLGYNLASQKNIYGEWANQCANIPWHEHWGFVEEDQRLQGG